MINFDLSTEAIHAARLINESKYVIAFTGAGISTPSGIADFRGEKEGLWRRYDPMQVASHTAFFNTPEIFFDWFRPLFISSWSAQPNPAHLGLAAMEKSQLIRSIITQNIDGLHQKGGSKNVYELHGTAMSFSCPSCNNVQTAMDVYELFLSGSLIPLCKNCREILKPDLVLFEELLPAAVWNDAEKEANCADLILVIGSSLEVFPAASIPRNAASRGCKLIINNLTPTPFDHMAEIVIPLNAAEFIPLLVQQCRK